jgi:receptor protein-tyrosine kinase
LIVGLIVGAAAAFVLALRNRRFGHRTDPETVLGVPLLAEIPRFNASASALPVIDDPSGPQAEAFRFGANAVIARVNQMELKSNVPRSMVVVTSGLLGDGKTMTTVNIGLAMATQGKAVLLVDADFGDPTLSRTLVGDTTTARGMTNVVEKTAPLADVLSAMDLGHGHHVDILTRGNVEISAGDFFDSKRTREFFSLLKSRYDYVLVDAPPLLQVSYSSTIAALSDGVIRVIPHEGKLSIQQELDDRLRLIGVETLGYVYNKAPKRPELQERHGSMRDPLGTGQLPA